MAEAKINQVKWRLWAQANMVAGWGSAPRLSKKLIEAGFAEEEVDALLTEVALEKGQRIRRKAVYSLVGGVLLVILPVALLVAQMSQETGRVNIFYGMVVVGLGMIGQGLYQRKLAQQFDRPATDASAPRRGRTRRQKRESTPPDAGGS
jgi:hypothetical protein